MKQISILLFLFASSIASACNWTNVNVGYGDSCNRYNFEVSGTVDTCFKIEAKIYLGTTLKATYSKRNFKHYFQDTGMYVVRVKIINTCTNCDTVIYKPIHVTCIPNASSGSGCNWTNVNVGYGDSCNRYNFEVSGTTDTCFKIEAKIYLGTTLKATYLKRNFKHYFQDTGMYVVRVKIINTCTNCDTVIYKQIRVRCKPNTSKGCNWSKAGIYYSQNCNKFTFEMGSFDTCFKYTTLVFRNGHADTISDDRIFTHTFSDTGTYYIRTTFRNKCTNCDTVIYKQIRVSCLLSTGCNWSKVGINYSQNCNKFTFEMGSFDTCFRYTTLAIRNGHVDTISYNRVFTHTFSDTGTYYIRTTFRNKCTKCDTVMYKEIRITCLTAGIQSWNDIAHPVSVYPNPAASSVTIGVENIHQLGEVNFVLYSPLGNVIYEQKVQGDTNEIPISHLSNGIYLLHLTSDKHVYAAKIQIQH